MARSVCLVLLLASYSAAFFPPDAYGGFGSGMPGNNFLPPHFGGGNGFPGVVPAASRPLPDLCGEGWTQMPSANVGFGPNNELNEDVHCIRIFKQPEVPALAATNWLANQGARLAIVRDAKQLATMLRLVARASWRASVQPQQFFISGAAYKNKELLLNADGNPVAHFIKENYIEPECPCAEGLVSTPFRNLFAADLFACPTCAVHSRVNLCTSDGVRAKINAAFEDNTGLIAENVNLVASGLTATQVGATSLEDCIKQCAEQTTACLSGVFKSDEDPATNCNLYGVVAGDPVDLTVPLLTFAAEHTYFQIGVETIVQ